MNGLELLLLGHKLIEIGAEAIPRSGFHTLTTSARTILVTVFERPGSSIKDITERTGFPQSLVSATVARFRDDGVMVTEPDPADRRRTLVSPAPGRREMGRRIASMATVDEALAARLGIPHDEVADIVAQLESLARRLSGARP
ncbi:helix-turn-helix domain-containing protein [Sphaerisporangium sp. NPDC005288]|uniref:MarR family winged helix-turn-helix transcriptional regulator n=1 Tax=Sphaerisporangium sp. NPDC005288 TaxID=3155114 RepID=UPI00339F5D81